MSSRPRVLVIVPAAGAGARFGGDTPKQFRPLAGKPILQHVLERFLPDERVDRVVVALPEVLLPGIEQPGTERLAFVAGGSSRQESVALALEAAAGKFDLVAVHDAVRPFFRRETFHAVLEAAAQFGAALPCLPVADTIHVVRDGFITSTPDRNELMAAQTPQCFRFELLREVVARAAAEQVAGTDEAGLAARYGHTVSVVPGDPTNFKITRVDDLALAEAHFEEWNVA